MRKQENKIPIVSGDEKQGMENSFAVSGENCCATGIFAKEGERAIYPPVCVGDIRYAVVYDDIANEWLADRYVVEGIAFFNEKWHCCDKDREWFEEGSDYALKASTAKRMLIGLRDAGEKVFENTK